MAKMTSPQFSVIRGSVAGTTYTANGFAAIVARARTIPTNPSTQYQQGIRNAFNTAKAAWQGLSAQDRENWDLWADTVYLTGPTGQYQVPGRQWFIGIYADRLYLAGRGITFGGGSTSPPVIPGLITMPVVQQAPPSAGTGYKLTLAVTTTELLIGYTFQSRAFGADRFFFKGPYRSNTLLSDTQSQVSDPIELERTGLTAGRHYFEHIRLITKAGPHRISLDLHQLCVAVNQSDLAALVPKRTK